MITKASEGSHLWPKTWKALAILWLRAMLADKTYLSTRPVSFITMSEIEVYQWADAARVILYGEHKRSKKRLKAEAVDVPKSTTGTST